ncbi:uncharacterized protein [Epargyreus clarus]|uniref:uncharacterized protein n=1 Tax=Epargyreus clarus TaxID=520877 RepID=UPI003C2E93FB
MFTCGRCGVQARDGAQCSLCSKQFDFPCAGITEVGYRKLGDRKATWKCITCKTGAASPVPGKSPTSLSPFATSDLDSVSVELRSLKDQMSSLPQLLAAVRSIQEDLTDLKSLKSEISDVKNSLDHIYTSVDGLTRRISEIDLEVQTLKKTKEDVARLQLRLEALETTAHESEQRARLNNIEIKGVPSTNSENLYNILSKISAKINVSVSNEQINYIARVPTHGDNPNKNIIVSLHNRYLRDNFVSAAKKCKSLTPLDIGLNGSNRIFVNDHLTVVHKKILNRAKGLAKERNFAFVWVKNCKIFVRKNTTSPIILIKTETDLKKIS